MSIKTIPQQYATSDGRTFATEGEARRHQTLMDARIVYEKARREYAQALAETQVTADGVPFQLGFSRDYYHITHRNDWPVMETVRFQFWNIDLQDDDHLVIRHSPDPNQDNRWLNYRIDRLYAVYGKAKFALLEARREYLADRQEEVDELAAESGVS